jgi:hypothetical protein
MLDIRMFFLIQLINDEVQWLSLIYTVMNTGVMHFKGTPPSIS